MPRDGSTTAARPRGTTPAAAAASEHETSLGSSSDDAPSLAGRGWILDAVADEQDAQAAQQIKREYHRDHMVAFRQRKKDSLANKKAFHQQLEMQLARRLMMRRAILLSGFALGLNDSRSLGPNHDELHDPTISPADRITKYQEIFSNLVDEAEFRRAENVDLQQQLEQHIKLKLLLHAELGLLQLVDLSEPESEDSADGAPPATRPAELRGFFTYFVENEPPFYFEPFTRHECDEFTEDGYRKVVELQRAFNMGELGMREVECLGWKAQRALERTKLSDGLDGPLVSRVRFTKRVRSPDGEARETLGGLAHFAYNSLSSAEKYAAIQRTRFVSHTLQTFGDHHQVSLRNAPDPMGTTNVRYLHLLTRVDDTYTAANGREYLRSTVLMLAVETPRHKVIREMLHRDEIFWITEGTAFISFVQIDDSTIEIDYGNVTKCLSDEQAQYFMIELGAQLIRWENQVMPPRLLPFFHN